MRHRQRSLLAVCVLAAVSFPTVMAAAQVDTAWVRRYDGPGSSYDIARDLQVDSAGNVYVTGVSWGDDDTRSDYATLKYDSTGVLLWVRRYDGPGDGPDNAIALQVDAMGNVLVTGSSWGEGTRSDYATLKYDPDGNLLWVQRYDSPTGRDDEAMDLAVDAAGNVCVTGGSSTLKYDSDGNLLWEAEGGKALRVDTLGNVYVIGVVYPYDIFKYDPAGRVLWKQYYVARRPGLYGNATDLQVDAIGSVYVTGYVSYNSPSHHPWTDYATIKFGHRGGLLWERRYNGPEYAGYFAHALQVDATGNVYITGSGRGRSQGDYATLKYDSNGYLLWERHHYGETDWFDVIFGPTIPSLIQMDVAGNVYVTYVAGYSPGPWGCDPSQGCTATDYGTLKYNPDGNVIWKQR